MTGSRFPTLMFILAIPALYGCSAPQAPPTDAAMRALAIGLQGRVDRFARVERSDAGRLRVTVHERRRTGARSDDRELLARVVALEAYGFGAALPGDSVTVIVQRPRRFGPLVWDGSVRRYVFTERPEVSPGARLF